MRIIIVDDHKMVSQGIRQFLERHGYDVVAEVAEQTEIIPTLLKFKPDVALIDLMMPGGDTYTQVEAIKRVLPDTKVIVLTGTQSPAALRKLVHSCIDGLLTKDGEPQEILDAISVINRGSRYISDLVEPYIQSVKVNLSGREHQILNMIVMGLTRSDIAKQLNVSAETIKTHRKNLMAKLDAHSTAELVVKALDM